MHVHTFDMYLDSNDDITNIDVDLCHINKQDVGMAAELLFCEM